MSQSAFGKLSDLIGFLFREGRFLKSPIVLYAFLASASRTLMIYAVNQAAAQGGPPRQQQQRL